MGSAGSVLDAAMPGVGTILSGGAGDLIGGITGANKTGDAYGKAAGASLAQQRSDRAAALGYAVSDEELQQLQQSIALNNQDIARKQKLLASADPALIEAGNQALQLMQGKNAASLKPLQDQRTQQRQQLQQTLASTLGPDYMNSSQGRAALNQFDQQSANSMTNAQQNAIGQYMGYVQNAEQFGNLNSNMQQQGSTADSYGRIASRKINAVTGSPIDASQQYAGELMKAKSSQGYMDKILGAGLSYAAPSKGAAGAGGAGAGGMAKGGMVKDRSKLTLKDMK